MKIIVQAGATPLRDINVNGVAEVVYEIQTAANQGLTGNELKAVVVERFGSPVAEQTK